MPSLLDDCVKNFGLAPRTFSRRDLKGYLHLKKPWWWYLPLGEDKLATLFKHREALLLEGVVVWGQIIQANAALFEEGRASCPGEVVYSLSPRAQENPEYLHGVAYRLGQLKETEPEDPKLRPIAEYLTSEMERVFGFPVPSSISPADHCMISTTFFYRKHLPQGKLCKDQFPLIVHPKDPFIATVLPSKYWPEKLVAWWSQEDRIQHS